MISIEPTPGHRPRRPRGRKKGNVRYSKMYMQRVGDARALKASIETLKARVVDGFSVHLAPELAEGEVLPDFGLSMELLGRSVESALERLRAAEHRVFEREREVAIVRRDSERLARRELYPWVVQLRRMIDARVGREDGRRVHGMSGKTLRKARRLHAQLDFLARVLEVTDREQPDPLIERVAAERETWLREIKPGYRQLTGLLDELADLEALEQLARDDKNEAIRSFDAAYGKARRLVEASFDFAGVSGKLSRMLRAYSHRRLLSREARRKRQARAEGRVTRTLRAAAASVTGWISGRPRNVA